MHSGNTTLVLREVCIPVGDTWLDGRVGAGCETGLVLVHHETFSSGLWPLKKFR